MADSNLALLFPSVMSNGSGGGDLAGDVIRDLASQQLAWATMPTWRMSLMAVVLAIGAVANAWVLYTGLRQKKLRNSSFHILLRSRTLSNLFLSVFLYPVLIMRLRTGLPRNSAEVELCNLSSLCMMWFVTVGLFTNVLVALNRTMSCHPTWPISDTLRGKAFTYGALVSVWVCAFVEHVCDAFVEAVSWKGVFACAMLDDIISNVLQGKTPLPVHPMKDIMIWELSVSVLLSVILSTCCYGLIARFLCCKTGISSTERKKSKTRAFIIIVVDQFIFLACWVPLIGGLVFEPVEVGQSAVYMTLPMLEAMVNPVFYLATMPAYRPGWWAKLRLGKRVAPSAEEGNTVNDGRTLRTQLGQLEQTVIS